MPKALSPGSISTNYGALTISARASHHAILCFMGRGQQQASAAPTRRGGKRPKKLNKKQLIEAMREINVTNPHDFYDSSGASGQVFITYDPGDNWHSRGWKVYRVGHDLGRDRFSSAKVNSAKEFPVFSTQGMPFKEAKDDTLARAQAWAGERFDITQWGRDPFGSFGDAAFIESRMISIDKALIKHEAIKEAEEKASAERAAKEAAEHPPEEASAPPHRPVLTREQTTTPIEEHTSHREAMTLGERIPVGQSGPWKIIRHTVTEEEARFDAMRSAFSSSGRGRYVPAGTYTGLEGPQGLMMSDTPDEMRDHVHMYHEAKRRGGRMLVHGLGLGMITQSLLSLENVEHVDVVDIDEDVIALVAPSFQGDIDSGRLTIHHADCFEKKWPPNTRWGAIWHDLWVSLSEDNLEEMATLHRKFGRRCDWQGSWGKEHIKYQRQRERRYSFY